MSEATLPLPLPEPVDTAVAAPATGQAVLEAIDLRKTYRVEFAQRGMLLKQLFLGVLGQREQQVLAIDGVSLRLEPGQALGVIGPNGSGKTTLLRLLCQLTDRDGGQLLCRGRTVGMIELGAGFQPTLTGRENIRLYGLVLGLSHEEVDAREPAIIEFAGLGRFLDAPLRAYSAGMKLRLGFACAVHADPDLLVVDEVIEVGDAEFKARCFERLRLLQEQGTALVLATHAPEHVRKYCDAILHLEAGRPRHLVYGRDLVCAYLDRIAGVGEEGLTHALNVEQALRDAELPDALASSLASARATMRSRLPTMQPPERRGLLEDVVERVAAVCREHPEQRARLLGAFCDLWLDLLQLADGTTVLNLWAPVRGLLREHLPHAGTLAERVALLERLGDVLHLEPGPLKTTFVELRELLRPQIARQVVSEGGNGEARPLLDRLEAIDLPREGGAELQLAARLLQPADGYWSAGARLHVELAIEPPADGPLAIELVVTSADGARLATSRATVEASGRLVAGLVSESMSLPPGGYTLLASADCGSGAAYAALPLTAVGECEGPAQLGGHWQLELSPSPTDGARRRDSEVRERAGVYAAHPLWRQRGLDFASRELAAAAPRVGELWMPGWRACADFGLMGLLFPADVGGRGLGARAWVSALEAAGERCSDRGLLHTVASHVLGCGVPLWRFARGAKQARWLERVATGRCVAAGAVSEPASGSDLFAMTTRAERTADGYRLTGEKSWVIGAPVAELLLVYALTDPDRGREGVSCFAVPTQREGLAVQTLAKHVLPGAPMGRIRLEGVPVSVEERVGEEGQGADILAMAQSWQRGLLLAPLLGMISAGLQRTMERLQTRARFGRPLAEFQTLRHRVAELSARLEGARMWLYRAASALENEPSPAALLRVTSQAKLTMGETIRAVGMELVQLGGASGLIAGAPEITMLADAVAATLASGSSELLREAIADDLLSPVSEGDTGEAEGG